MIHNTSPVGSLEDHNSGDFNSNVERFEDFLDNDSPRYSDDQIPNVHLQASKQINRFTAVPMTPHEQPNSPQRKPINKGFMAIPMDDIPNTQKVTPPPKPKSSGSRLLRKNTIDKAIDTASMITGDNSMIGGPSAIQKVPSKQKLQFHPIDEFDDGVSVIDDYQGTAPLVSEIPSTLSPFSIPPIPKKHPVSQSNSSNHSSSLSSNAPLSGAESFQLFTQLPPIPPPPSNQNPFSAKKKSPAQSNQQQQNSIKVQFAPDAHSKVRTNECIHPPFQNNDNLRIMSRDVNANDLVIEEEEEDIEPNQTNNQTFHSFPLKQSSNNQNQNQNQNTFANQNQNQNTFANQNQNTFANQNQNTFANQNQNTFANQNQNTFANQNQNTFANQNQNTFANQNQNQNTFANQNQNTFANQNQNTFANQNQNTFANQNQNTFANQNQNTFANQNQNQNTFANQNQNTFANQNQNTFANQNQNTFANQNQNTFANQNQNTFANQNQNTFANQNQNTFANQNQNTFANQNQNTFANQNQNTFANQNQNTFANQSFSNEQTKKHPFQQQQNNSSNSMQQQYNDTNRQQQQNAQQEFIPKSNDQLNNQQQQTFPNQTTISQIQFQQNQQIPNQQQTMEQQPSFQFQNQQSASFISPISRPYQPLFNGPLGSLEIDFVYSFNRSISSLKRIFTGEFNNLMKQQVPASAPIDSIDIDEFTSSITSEIGQIIEVPIQHQELNHTTLSRRISSVIDEETKLMTIGLKEADCKNITATENLLNELKKLEIEIEKLSNTVKLNTEEIIQEFEKERSESNSMREFDQSFNKEIERRSRSIQIKQVELNSKITHQNIEKETIERMMNKLNQKKQNFNPFDSINPERGTSYRELISNEINKIRQIIQQTMIPEDVEKDIDYGYENNSLSFQSIQSDVSNISNESVSVLQDELENQKKELMNIQMSNRFLMSQSQSQMQSSILQGGVSAINQTSFQPTTLNNNLIRQKRSEF